MSSTVASVRRVASGRAGRSPRACSISIERLHVLLERLLERQLLRPLDVVADRLHVDARPRDRQPVVDLHRLQLDDAAAGEPRQHDVLRELRVRPGGGAERRRGRAAVDAHRQVEVAAARQNRRAGRSKICPRPPPRAASAAAAPGTAPGSARPCRPAGEQPTALHRERPKNSLMRDIRAIFEGGVAAPTVARSCSASWSP